MKLAMSSAVFTILRKEIIDSLRDRRTLLYTLLGSALSGPLVLLVIFTIIAQQSEKIERLKLPVIGQEHAPALVTFLERAQVNIETAPDDYVNKIKNGELDVVLEIDKKFPEQVAAGQDAILRLHFDSSRQRSRPSISRIQGLLRSYARQWGEARLVMRGVAHEVAFPLQIQGMDYATAQQTGSAILSMLAFYAVFAVLLGGLASALDSTAGERERGSLEPLLLLPMTSTTIALGKWLAVVFICLIVILLTLVGYYLTLRSGLLPRINVAFFFGIKEALRFLIVLLPLGLLFPVLQLTLGTLARTFKEAQTNASLLIFGISFLPLVQIFQPGKDPAWLVWIPVSGQFALLNRILRGEAITALDWFASYTAPLAGTALMLLVFTHLLRREAVVSS